MAWALNLGGDGGDKIEDEEIRLSAPLDEEAVNPTLHVTRCASRYSITIRRLNQIDRKILVLGLLVVIQIATSPPAMTLWERFLK